METPHFLDVQIQAFERLLQPDIEGDRRDVGLERIFNEIFPIDDVNGNYSLEFQSYSTWRAEVLGGRVHGARHDVRGAPQGDAAPRAVGGSG